MPEGPQIARHARLQSEVLVGRRLGVDSPNGRSDEVAALVDGATLRAIVAVGKHLVYDFGEDRYLHVHLGRFGSFREGAMPLPEVRGIVRLRLYSAERWYELRGAIAVDIYDAEMVGRLRERIGQNPLDSKADLRVPFAKITRSKTAIGLQLMDQSIVAGIGNIYRSEVLFLHGVDPFAPGPTLEIAVWRAMWKDFARLMADGAKIGRIVTTWPRDRKKPTGPVRSEDRFYVYHRTGKPCRRCGTPIVEGKLGARNVYWCPRDQQPTAADVDQAARPRRSRVR